MEATKYALLRRFHLEAAQTLPYFFRIGNTVPKALSDSVDYSIILVE